MRALKFLLAALLGVALLLAVAAGVHYRLFERGWFHFTPRLVSRVARQLIATGAMERPFPIPGWTLPGVMGVGAAQIALALLLHLEDG